ncbi:MAG: O-methyltransferase [Candidatus Izimaplasma sp.]|nr:O-methyltransferase [Candidatus Izimaplasma bacterium]
MENKYLENVNVKETNPLLVSLKKYAKLNNVPIITDEGINFINQIILISNAKNILEIGTAIGYSAINMALKHNVSVTTIERNNEMYELAKINIVKAKLEQKITLINSDALELDETTMEMFDLIFIDAAKAQSINFFNKYKKKLNDSGIIITDNLLFHDLIDQSAKTRNLRQLLRKIDNFNKFIVEQEDFNTYLYQLGDGMSLSVKKRK